MVIQMIKQKNPENTFYVPYLQPIKSNIEQAILEKKLEKIELESFVLPKEASIYIDSNGAESIYVAGRVVEVMTEIPSGIVYLINNDIHLQMEKHVLNKETVISFPNSINKAV